MLCTNTEVLPPPTVTSCLPPRSGNLALLCPLPSASTSSQATGRSANQEWELNWVVYTSTWSQASTQCVQVGDLGSFLKDIFVHVAQAAIWGRVHVHWSENIHFVSSQCAKERIEDFKRFCWLFPIREEKGTTWGERKKGGPSAVA